MHVSLCVRTCFHTAECEQNANLMLKKVALSADVQKINLGPAVVESHYFALNKVA